MSLFRRRPAPELAHDIVVASLARAAQEYAAALEVGDDIVEATDARVIAPIRHLLPQALARRGLALAQIPGGWRIERAPFRVAARPAECGVCGESFFDCEHGVGLVIAINWDEAPR